MSKILLHALFCILSSSYIGAMDYVNAMLMYKHKAWQKYSLAQKETSVLALQHLAAKKVATLIFTADFYNYLNSNLEEVIKELDIFDRFGSTTKNVLIAKLLKNYASKIAAAHITPKYTFNLGLCLTLLQFNDEGTLLAGAQDSRLYLWDMIAQDQLFMRDLGVHIDALSFAHRSQDLAVGGRNFEGEPLVFFLNMKGEVIKSIAVPAKIESICFSTDDKAIAVGTTSNEVHSHHKIYIFSMITDQQLYLLSVHADSLDLLRSLYNSLTHRSFSIAYKQATPFKIMSFDANTKTVYLNYLTSVWRFQPDQEDPQWHITYGNEEKIINTQKGYYMWANGRPVLYDYFTDQELCDLNQKGSVSVRAFSTDGNRLVSMSKEGLLQIYDCPTYKQVISQLNVLQATFLAHQLQQKEQEQSYNPYKRLASYFTTSEDQQDDFQHMHSSLPYTFQKMIE